MPTVPLPPRTRLLYLAPAFMVFLSLFLNRNKPYLDTKPILYASATISIQAPGSTVWTTFSNTTTWREWNPWCRNAYLIHPTGVEEGARGLMRVGSSLRFDVWMHTRFNDAPWHFSQEGKDIITAVEVPAKVGSGKKVWRAEWFDESSPDWLLRCRRESTIEEVEGEGVKESVFTTTAQFYGPFAWPVSAIIGEGMQRDLEAMAGGLRGFVEGKGGHDGPL
ncbi:hypothetical protein M501DRAFT_987927 [Patellaria atrata CBS 101060]|uniref:Coenzyme Q-binding protein COQ10 START domain-containing protein n=1 Tax=Patellaria atrata CBS 101060 TaxID=1346257 RepID=A0A9P4S3M4_9PEZI|nr:hypothetical protein M501DRAFT_987927 [Patellaria atrata CBS 101060]